MSDSLDLLARHTGSDGADRFAEEGPSEFERFFAPFVRHARLFAIVASATFLTIVVGTLLVPKHYTTATKLMAGNSSDGKPSADSDTLPLLNALIAMSGQQSAETYADLLQEAPLADRVAHDLHLDVSGSTLVKHVAVTPVANTAIIKLSATWRDPATSAAIANGFATAFVRQQREFVQSQADDAIAFLSAQLPIAAKRMNDAQYAESTYEARNAIADIGAQTQAMLQRATTLDTQIDEAKLSQRVTSASLDRIGGSLANVSSTAPKDRSVVPNPSRAALVAERAQVAVQIKSSEAQYTSAYPALIALRARLQQLDGEIAREPATSLAYENSGANPLYDMLVQQRATLQSQQAVAAAQIAELEKQRRALRPQIVRLPDETRRIFDLRNAAKQTRDVYAQLQAKAEEATLERTTVPNNIAVVVPATASSASVSPSLTVNVLAGFILALALGTTAIFFANFLDRTLKTERDVEMQLSLPVLTHVPELKRSQSAAVSERDRAIYAESFLQLFWSMRYASPERIRSVTIASASPGEGKSTVALNAAAALADTHPGVLLIDADFRRPTLHAMLGTSRAFGLSDVLLGTHTLSGVVHATEHPGLYFLAAGTPVIKKTSLLQSDRFAALIAEAQERFAMVVVDTPALNAVLDGVAGCLATDATVLVVSAATTDMRQVRRALRRLQSLRLETLIGVVLNRAKPPAAEFGDYFSGDQTFEQPALPAASRSAASEGLRRPPSPASASPGAIP